MFTSESEEKFCLCRATQVKPEPEPQPTSVVPNLRRAEELSRTATNLEYRNQTLRMARHA